jgi:hypothetical protein
MSPVLNILVEVVIVVVIKPKATSSVEEVHIAVEFYLVLDSIELRN